MANKNRNSNQPRRKRNKKPVKRYSEEYSNRPNPYTGYSADGNFHPEAKKHTLDEASVAVDSETLSNTIEEETVAEAAPAVETESAAADKGGNEKTSSRRKKNVDRDAEKKAQQAKNEARRAAVSKIAQGVAAHSVSEQIIEDIASMSDVMESMAKADSNKFEVEEQVSSTDAYDDLLPTESEKTESDDETEQAEIALPVVLGEDDVLPFDRNNDSEEATENSEKQVDSEDISADDSAEIPPLDPADLIPVLDFDKPPTPVLNFSEPAESETGESEQDDDSSSDNISTATIEEILAAVEKDNLGPEESKIIAENREFGFDSDVVFDTSKSEGWDSIILPPDEDILDEQFPELQAQTAGEALTKLLDACFNADQIADTSDDESSDGEDIFALSDDGAIAAEVLSELNSELADNEYSTEDIFDITDDISEITAEAFGDDDDDTAQNVGATFDITEEDISEVSSDDSEIVSAEDEAADSLFEITETEAAVNTKLQKLVEAAELAEILRVENEEAEIVTGDSECTENEDNFSLNKVEEPADSDEPDSVEAGEDVKEYCPQKAQVEAEDVFESVLIVDDGSSDSDSDIETETQDDTLFLRAKTADECPTAVFKLPEGPIILPTDIDDGDFQEQWLDDEEDGDEMASRNKRARRRISAFIGAVTILFTLLVAIGVLKTAVTGLNSIGSTGEKKAEYTQFISPVVITDPKPFESIEGADNQMMLESAIWSVLDSNDDASDFDYEYDDTGKIVLPAKEVEEAGKKLFGSDVKLNMDVLSENDGNVLYYYDSIEDKFHITTGGIIGPSAIITKIAQKSDYVSLIVGYCSQADINSAASDDVEAYKYMEYILSFNEKGEYHIESIRDYTED